MIHTIGIAIVALVLFCLGLVLVNGVNTLPREERILRNLVAFVGALLWMVSFMLLGYI